MITGSQATVRAVSAALEDTQLAHVAAHGTFRADNPQFSSLTLADGALTVYDLERLATPPRRMVLSACDSGLSAVAPGDALMGLAAALLSVGTATLIASVAPVPDAGGRRPHGRPARRPGRRPIARRRPGRGRRRPRRD